MVELIRTGVLLGGRGFESILGKLFFSKPKLVGEFKYEGHLVVRVRVRERGGTGYPKRPIFSNATSFRPSRIVIIIEFRNALQK